MSLFQLSSQHKETPNFSMKNYLSWQLNSSNPLFSTIITLYILILLYFPHIFHKIISSPLIITTLILLLCLLRLGASQQNTCHNELGRANIQTLTVPNPRVPEPVLEPKDRDQENEHNDAREPTGLESGLHCDPVAVQEVYDQDEEDYPRQLSSEASSRPEPEHESTELNKDIEEKYPGELSSDASLSLEPKCDPESKAEPEPPYKATWLDLGSMLFDPKQTFVEWDVGAPLDVIYETYEGEEHENEGQENTLHEQCVLNTLGKYPSLSRYYPESDSESSSSSSWDGEISEIERWHEEKDEEREGLIEIALDCESYDHRSCYFYNGTNSNHKEMVLKKTTIEVMQFDEEDNLIEIDISPTRASEIGFSW